jgi:hypothetical protein
VGKKLADISWLRKEYCHLINARFLMDRSLVSLREETIDEQKRRKKTKKDEKLLDTFGRIIDI